MSDMIDAMSVGEAREPIRLPIQQAWKLAVHRPPPRIFYIQFLKPNKMDVSYLYCMRVNSVENGVVSRPEYFLWRRWEDLLYFQEWLEQKYATLRYQQQHKIDMAQTTSTSTSTSRIFDLKPNAIEDFQVYVPQLSQIGGSFQESETLASQRQAQLKSFITGLFRTDPPTILREIQTASEVADFFSQWHEDLDRITQLCLGHQSTELDISNISLSSTESEVIPRRINSNIGSIPAELPVSTLRALPSNRPSISEPNVSKIFQSLSNNAFLWTSEHLREDTFRPVVSISSPRRWSYPYSNRSAYRISESTIASLLSTRLPVEYLGHFNTSSNRRKNHQDSSHSTQSPSSSTSSLDGFPEDMRVFGAPYTPSRNLYNEEAERESPNNPSLSDFHGKSRMVGDSFVDPIRLETHSAEKPDVVSESLHTTASGAINSTKGVSLSIQVIHDSCALSFKVVRTISFAEVRRKLIRNFDIMAINESEKLPRDFVVAWQPAGWTKGTPVHFIHSDEEWEQALTETSEEQMVLRVVTEEGGV